MPTTHLYDLAVKTGEYQAPDGNNKGRYENVGKILRNDNGQFMLLKRTFNPAGVNADGDMIMVSMFEPKPREGQHRQQQGSGNTQGQSGGGGHGGGAGDDMEIPF